MSTNSCLSIEEARALYEDGDAAHDFDHVLRVLRLAERIAAAEGADSTVVRLAALLHDVPIAVEADSQLSERADHHLRAAGFAKMLLTERGLGTEQVENVVHCIKAHRYRDQSIRPQTLEAKCLYDADKLDSIGAIGVGRAFAYAGGHGHRLWTTPIALVPGLDRQPVGGDYTPVHEHVYKLSQILEGLHTETARAVGEQRHAFMVEFFNVLDDEMAGRR